MNPHSAFVIPKRRGMGRWASRPAWDLGGRLEGWSQVSEQPNHPPDCLRVWGWLQGQSHSHRVRLTQVSGLVPRDGSESWPSRGNWAQMMRKG